MKKTYEFITITQDENEYSTYWIFDNIANCQLGKIFFVEKWGEYAYTGRSEYLLTKGILRDLLDFMETLIPRL